MNADSLFQAKDSLNLKQQKEEILNAVKPENVKDGIVDSVSYVKQIFERLIFWLIDSIPDVIRAFLVLFIGIFLIRMILRLVNRRFEKRKVDVSLRGFLVSIFKFILYAMLLLTVIQTLGFKTTAILGALSGLVLAAGLALQGSLSNFAGGVLILLFRPFEVGDYIENPSGTEGTVEKIDLLYTTLTNAQGIKVFSPNGALANSVIKNYSKITNRRFDYIIGIGYEDNIQTARKVILEVLHNDSRVIHDPAPEVFVAELADSSVNLNVRAWATKADYWPVRNALQETIKVALDKAGIEIPFPQTDLHIITPSEGSEKAEQLK